MRISDWSSDVCSADLSPARVTVPGVDGADPPAKLLDPRRRIAGSDDDQAAVGRAVAARRRIAGRGHGPDQAGEAVDHRIAAGLAEEETRVGPPHRRVVRTGEPDRKSNTSELPSLMRNS